jgi:hypothetical protein
MEYAQACDLITAVIHRARVDAGQAATRIRLDNHHVPSTCDCTMEPHAASACAKQFLGRLDTFLHENPQPSPSEIVQEILEVMK